MPSRIDETGNKYGKWTVLHYDEDSQNGKKGGARWICQCECGTVKSILGTELRRGRTKSCGCLQKKDLSGQRFGKLTVLSRDPDNSSKYLCRCQCGKITSVFQSHLIRGNTKSCGQSSCQDFSKSIIDISGQKFGKLTAIKMDKHISGQSIRWICKCDCGKEKSILKAHLLSGKIKSCGCGPKSWGEKIISYLLVENNIPFETEYSFSNCYHKDKNKPLRFDFFVNNSYVIEFDGRQHFMENSWSSSSEKLKDLQVRDQIKNKYCLKNNIPIIRIPYYYINNITIQDLLPVSSNFLLKEGGI